MMYRVVAILIMIFVFTFSSIYGDHVLNNAILAFCLAGFHVFFHSDVYGVFYLLYRQYHSVGDDIPLLPFLPVYGIHYR